MLSYNTLIVLAGASLLGASAGTVGTYALLRGRALVGDALAHAALPGMCLSFLVLGQKSLPAMLAGALLSGLVGIGIIAGLRRWTRIKEDAAIGMVLSVLFGAGIVLSRLIQNRSTTGSKAGLDSYILGKTAGMLASDVYLIAAVGGVSLLVIVLFYKEFKAVVFDIEFAKAQGWPVVAIDIALMTLVALSVVIGLPAVGVVLMAALLILPGTAARFWTNQLSLMLIIAGLFGFIAALVGTAVSARFERLPAGPIIVLTGTALFLISMAVAPRRGLVARGVRQLRFRRALADRAALQKLYEARRLESAMVSLSARTTSRLKRRGLIEDVNGNNPRLTAAGQQRGAQIVRGRKLWQVFLTEYPDLAPSMANLAEESVEGLVPDEVVVELVRKLESAERSHDIRTPLEASHG